MGRKKKTKETQSTNKKHNLISMVLDQCEKEYGSDVVVNPENKKEIDKLCPKNYNIPSGSITFDYLTRGGIPRGRIITFVGLQNKGKSTMCTILGAQMQKAGAILVYIDAENRIDINYMEKLGVNIHDKTKFRIIRSNHSGHVFDIADKVLSTGEFSCIVIDSIASIFPESEAKKGWGESIQIGKQALELTNFLNRTNPKIAKTGSTLLLTTHLKAKSAGTFWYLAATGGNAMMYFSTLIIKIDWKDDDIIRDGETPIGVNMLFSLIKTNLSPPQKERRICFRFEAGFYEAMQIIQVGIQEGIINKSASWLSYGEGKKEVKVQGEYNFCKYLEEHPNVMKEIEVEIKKLWGMKI